MAKGSKKRKNPKWLNSAVFYEIYPQSFNDTNGDGIGDFQGIIEKLEYIKGLGCNAIWMNPCFESPFMDAGYDVSDYYKAAPRYGTNDDLKRLFDKAHELKMHVLLDLVPGHTSVEHPWFKESMKADKNKYTDRYIWTDNIWEGPEGMGSIRGFSERLGSCAVNFFSHQPALNYGFYKCDKPWQQPVDAEGPKATVEEMKNVMRFWLKMGCDGFRVDMAHSLVKNDKDYKGTIRLWQGIRESFLDKEFPEAVLISEWGEPDKSIIGGFHMDFVLPFGPSHYNELFRSDEPYFSKRGRGDASKFVKKYMENYEKTDRKGLICIPSGNHDTPRFSKYLDVDEMKLAFAFILTMPGAPFIYYGDEIGMRYVEGLNSVEGGYERTGTRTPMQWDDSKNAGFSDADKDKLYIRQDQSKDRPTVKAQISDENSLYSEVKRLISFRKSHKALKNKGDIEFVYAKKNEYPLAYVRSAKIKGQDGEKDTVEKLLVMINPSGKKQSFKCKYELGEKLYGIGGDAKQSDGKVTVDKQTAVVYTCV